jgi:glycogen(starch) synthase
MSASLPQRVLMTADTIGGVWTYALELCRAFQTHEIEVVLATMGAPLTRFQRAEVAPLHNVRVFESRYKLEWMESPWMDVAAAGDWLLSLEERFCPDLIHLNGYTHAALPWQAPKLVVGHSCVLSWWKAVKADEAPAEWDLYRQAVKRGLHSAEMVIAPTHAMLGALHEHYGPLANTKVIPNGRRLPANTRAEKEALIVSAGRLWDEAKNVSALASIAPRLPWRVCLAGENGQNSFAGLHDIKYLGRLSSDELSVWLARASIFALPAKYEPFGLSILEAALSGCALVLGDIPSLREVWGDAAMFVPPEDADALERTLRELIADEPRRNELARRAVHRAHEFTPERTAKGYLEAYSELLDVASEQNTQPEAACAS